MIEALMIIELISFLFTLASCSYSRCTPFVGRAASASPSAAASSCEAREMRVPTGGAFVGAIIAISLSSPSESIGSE